MCGAPLVNKFLYCRRLKRQAVEVAVEYRLQTQPAGGEGFAVKAAQPSAIETAAMPGDAARQSAAAENQQSADVVAIVEADVDVAVCRVAQDGAHVFI